jgi:hypothetical protein
MFNIVRVVFKCLIRLTIIKTYLWNNVIKYFPSHIKSIKVLDTKKKTVSIYNKNIKDLLNETYDTNEASDTNKSSDTNKLHKHNNIYYIFSVWNQKALAIKNYIVSRDILMQIINFKKNITSIQVIEKIFVYNLNLYHKQYFDNNIFSIMIHGKDITHIFDKYKLSIAVPNNVTAEVLYIYYKYACNKYNISLNKHNSYSKLNTEPIITIVDYNLDEKEYSLDKYITNI